MYFGLDGLYKQTQAYKTTNSSLKLIDFTIQSANYVYSAEKEIYDKLRDVDSNYNRIEKELLQIKNNINISKKAEEKIKNNSILKK